MPSFFDFNTIAHKIGVQLYREAAKKAYENGTPNKAKDLAVAMTNKFASNILEAIDEEAKFQSAKDIN